MKSAAVKESARTIRARELRSVLRAQLGGKCDRCGATENLEFHLAVGDGAAHHLMSSRDRVYFYAKEVARRNCCLLCADCHRRVTVARARFRLHQRRG